MNKRTKIWLTLGLMSVLAIVLSGCTPSTYGTGEPITADTEGFGNITSFGRWRG